jgi:hypothetical protein
VIDGTIFILSPGFETAPGAMFLLYLQIDYWEFSGDIIYVLMSDIH